jgi:hypothetical protein
MSQITVKCIKVGQGGLGEIYPLMGLLWTVGCFSGFGKWLLLNFANREFLFSISRHPFLQFFKPVKDDVDFGRGCSFYGCVAGGLLHH